MTRKGIDQLVGKNNPRHASQSGKAGPANSSLESGELFLLKRNHCLARFDDLIVETFEQGWTLRSQSFENVSCELSSTGAEFDESHGSSLDGRGLNQQPAKHRSQYFAENRVHVARGIVVAPGTDLPTHSVVITERRIIQRGFHEVSKRDLSVAFDSSDELVF